LNFAIRWSNSRGRCSTPRGNHFHPFAAQILWTVARVQGLPLRVGMASWLGTLATAPNDGRSRRSIPVAVVAALDAVGRRQREGDDRDIHIRTWPVVVNARHG
jgi:hypothetical protein